MQSNVPRLRRQLWRGRWECSWQAEQRPMDSTSRTRIPVEAWYSLTIRSWLISIALVVVFAFDFYDLVNCQLISFFYFDFATCHGVFAGFGQSRLPKITLPFLIVRVFSPKVSLESDSCAKEPAKSCSSFEGVGDGEAIQQSNAWAACPLPISMPHSTFGGLRLKHIADGRLHSASIGTIDTIDTSTS